MLTPALFTGVVSLEIELLMFYNLSSILDLLREGDLVKYYGPPVLNSVQVPPVLDEFNAHDAPILFPFDWSLLDTGVLSLAIPLLILF